MWSTGSRCSSPPLLSVRRYRGGESSAARKRNKTMESVRHSTANGFTAASPPPSIFMCKSIHRVLMAPAMHDTDSFKWPREKNRIFHTPAELAENNSGGLYWISISLCQNGAKCLFTVLMHCVMALVWFWLIFASDDCIQHYILPCHAWTLFSATQTWHKEELPSCFMLNKVKLNSAFSKKKGESILLFCVPIVKVYTEFLSYALNQLLVELWIRSKLECWNPTVYWSCYTRLKRFTNTSTNSTLFLYKLHWGEQAWELTFLNLYFCLH